MCNARIHSTYKRNNANYYPRWQLTDGRHRWNWPRMCLTFAVDSHRRTVAAECTSLITTGKKLLCVLLTPWQSYWKRCRINVTSVKVRWVWRHTWEKRRQRTWCFLRSQLDRSLVVRTAGCGGRTCTERRPFATTTTCCLLQLLRVQWIREVATITGCCWTGRWEARLITDVRKQFTLDVDSRSTYWNRSSSSWDRWQTEASILIVTVVNSRHAVRFLVL